MIGYMVLLGLGVCLVLFGMVLLLRYPDRQGGSLKAFSVEVNSQSAGIVVVLLGAAAV